MYLGYTARVRIGGGGEGGLDLRIIVNIIFGVSTRDGTSIVPFLFLNASSIVRVKKKIAMAKNTACARVYNMCALERPA